MRYFNIDREVRTVLIVSALPADGKTTVAVHLAAAAASSGAKALLLEADLRRPTVSQRVGSAASLGLAEVLTHGAELSEVIREISIQNGSAILRDHATLRPHHGRLPAAEPARAHREQADGGAVGGAVLGLRPRGHRHAPAAVGIGRDPA